MQYLVEVHDLHKQFPIKGSDNVVNAVTGVDLNIAKGETLGLIGESGSGKTTIGRLILRLIEPTSGKIIFDGQDIAGLSADAMRRQRHRMQMVFQDPYASLDPRMAIHASISEPLRFAGVDKKRARERVREVVGEVGLDEEVLDKYPHQLSAGDQQRVGIARAMATRPSLIVLDEPVSSLDLTIQAQILELLVQIQEQSGVSYLYISHDLTTVKDICHRVSVLYLGTVAETGTKEDVFQRPIHPYSRALLSSALPPDPRISRPRYRLSGEIPSPINLPSGCVLHNRCPEAVTDCARIVPRLESIDEVKRRSEDDGSYNGHSQQAACIRAKEMVQKPFKSPF